MNETVVAKSFLFGIDGPSDLHKCVPGTMKGAAITANRVFPQGGKVRKLTQREAVVKPKPEVVV